MKPGLDLSAIDNIFEIPFSRSPYSFDNIKAYFALKKIIDSGNYDAVHCHTPMGAVVARLAAKKARKGKTKVIYTAHGFHFFKGASRKNWMFFFPVEKYLSRYTDCLITINNEDYELAKHKKFKCKKLYKVCGVGVDTNRFHPFSREEKSLTRAQYGYDSDSFLMIYPADFSDRKNHSMLLKAFKITAQKHNDIKLLLPGPIESAQQIQQLAAELGIKDKIDFLGYRRDIEQLVGMSNISLSSSKQEGLPVNLIEAMALGNPIVATNVRGNNDLVKDGENGYLIELNDYEKMAEKMILLIENPDLVDTFKKNNLKMVRDYSMESVIRQMIDAYKSLGLI